MPRQTFGLQRGMALVLDTPEGLVRIRMDRRHVTVECPGKMRVHRHEDRVLADARFTKQGEHGELVPAYQVLVPVTDEKGSLIGVEMPRPLLVGG